MTIHRLAAGSGYAYLTRQVAAADSTELGSMPLADYYAAKGEAPGRWIGAGLDGLGGVEAGEVVSAAQMGHLFGAGEHPVTGLPLGRAQRKKGVAGFDLTFSPVKSVSALWAVAPQEIARRIEEAHDAAVADALAYVERSVLFTREGTDGVRQVETRGLIAAAFRHRDSRAGDPDLHTHVAVANKVQASSGRWLAIYSHVLFQHTVAISETYNTALEHHLAESLGVRFENRMSPAERRPVREIVGVAPDLCRRWSQRGQVITVHEAELVADFVSAHGRAPSEKERLGLVQQANLVTRDRKHDPLSETDQRRTWRVEAAEVLGSRAAVDAMVRAALRTTPGRRQAISRAWVAEVAAVVVGELETRRATWQQWHLEAEVQRQVRMLAPDGISAAQLPGLVDLVIAATEPLLINLTPDRDPLSDQVQEPPSLRRSDGTSVYRHTGADHYTSARIVAAERRLVKAAELSGDFAFSADEVDITLGEMRLAGTRLNDGQQRLVHAMASGGQRLRLGLAPAGSGKTTAVRALARVWTDRGYEAIGLAPSAVAAKVLGEATGMPSETLAKLADEITTATKTGAMPRTGMMRWIGAKTLVVIDEAGMADTLTLDQIVAFCLDRGATVRLLGDDQQLAAVGAGGVLRDIAHLHGAERLDEIVRFTDPAEAHASTDLRDGVQGALGFYLDHDRIHTGDHDECLTAVLTAWREGTAAGADMLMLAARRDLVAELNARARASRLAGAAPRTEVALADGNRVSVGDMVVTRANERRLRTSGTDWVKNGDRWTVTGVRRGGLKVRHRTSGLTVTLPPEYVAESVELGYATTVHAAQGVTADAVHGIVTGTEDRQLLYTMLTRGRNANHVHVIAPDNGDDRPDAESCDAPMLPGLQEQMTAVETVTEILGRDGAAVSATTASARGESYAERLHDAANRYRDGLLSATRHLVDSDVEEALEAAGPGPLPWLAGMPTEVLADEVWGPYLSARARHLTAMADVVLHQRPARPPAWARSNADVLGPRGDRLRDEVTIWRAAHGVPDDEPRLTGPPVEDPVARRHQRRLDARAEDRLPASVRAWRARIIDWIGAVDDDTTRVAKLLDQLHRRGHNVPRLVQRATSGRPLPAEHATAALGYRIQRGVRLQQQFDGRNELDRPATAQRSGPPTLGL